MYSGLTSLDCSLAPELQRKIDKKTKPVGSLGKLEEIAMRVGLIQQTLEPSILAPHIMVFAGDHGAARHGISAYPQEVTWQMVENILVGGAAINVFCRHLGIGLSVVDAGVNHHFTANPGLIDAKIAPGTASYISQPAMSATERDTALSRGGEEIHKLAARGCNCVGFGEMGIGNSASASLLTHCLISDKKGGQLAGVAGRGAGLDDAGLDRKLRLLEESVIRGGRINDPLKLVAEYGGFEIAMMAGAMLQSARERMILVIDGFIVTTALLIAHALAPEVLDYCLFAHRSQEPGHRVQLEYLGVKPLLDMEMRLGEGTGAALAMPLVQAAVGFLNEMASFESAGVHEKI
ncbi:MAG: nicotinate-nucleotide--dimethylbenzimidazole phosphoribosyltransferase [Syntrophales bacterium]|nr:nicotinate-nucleotide--dimethylbenzimidazole phosphoribosyltransferase [Syntrophales bacterium]